MDHEAFDRILRALGTAGSRCAALGALLGSGALGAVEAAVGKPCACGKSVVRTIHGPVWSGMRH